MATLQFQIPDAAVPRVLAAFSAHFNYQETVDGAPNPESEIQFTRRMIREFMLDIVIRHEARQAAEEATIAKISEIREQVQVT